MSERDQDRHVAAQHAMQTGVALMLQHNAQAGDPKHLRVGINTALCDHAALVRLLIDKGVITDEEYFAAIADEMEREVGRYEEKLKGVGILPLEGRLG